MRAKESGVAEGALTARGWGGLSAGCVQAGVGGCDGLGQNIDAFLHELREAINNELMTLHQAVQYFDAGLQFQPFIKELALIRVIDAFQGNDHIHTRCLMRHPLLSMGFGCFQLFIPGFDGQHNVVKLHIGAFRLIRRGDQGGEFTMVLGQIVHSHLQIMDDLRCVGNVAERVQEVDIIVLAVLAFHRRKLGSNLCRINAVLTLRDQGLDPVDLCLIEAGFRRQSLRKRFHVCRA